MDIETGQGWADLTHSFKLFSGHEYIFRKTEKTLPAKGKSLKKITFSKDSDIYAKDIIKRSIKWNILLNFTEHLYFLPDPS